MPNNTHVCGFALLAHRALLVHTSLSQHHPDLPSASPAEGRLRPKTSLLRQSGAESLSSAPLLFLFSNFLPSLGAVLKNETPTKALIDFLFHTSVNVKYWG